MSTLGYRPIFERTDGIDKASKTLKIDRTGYKVGSQEIAGMHAAMSEVLAPLLAALKDRIYWDDNLGFGPAEYKSRDGFIPHSHNKGGLELHTVIPKCEEYNFGFLEFGECEDCGEAQCGYHGQECGAESEGHLDAAFRVWLKFEGFNADGRMEFYLVASGGNGDAPYFREKHFTTLFERSFTARTLAEFRTRGARAVKALVRMIEEG